MIIHAQWWSIPPDSNLESEMFPIFNFPFPKFFKWTLRLFLFFEYSEEAIWVLLLLHSTKESKRWRLERRTSNARLPKKRRISIPRSFRRRLFTCLLWMIHEEENAKKRAASIYYPPYLPHLPEEERHTQHRYSFGVNVRITMVVRSVHQVERSITSQIAGRQGEVFS